MKGNLALSGCLTAALAIGAAPAADTSSRAPDLFATVRVIFKEKCLGCHGEGDELGGNLDLRSREAMLKGGDGGPSVVPGKPDESLLYEAVLRESEPVMPPKEANKLSPDELAALQSWIEAGAPWSEVKPTATAAASEVWTANEEDTWAFRPVRRHPVPRDGIDASQVKTPVDAFIQQALNAKQIKPSPPVDKVGLIRRATFDLTGLPPTPEEIDAFLKDETAGAFHTVIDRLLASPRYGEQWGRHWLDVVRYADTDGFSNDYERPNAWRYRDYVVRSFNHDKPFDRFLVEQVAGDELGPDDPELAVAVGFLRMGPWEQTGMSVAAVTRQLFLDDVTHNTATAFMGLTMGCCRCHDHKFDPLPTKDYYRLQAVFAPTQFEERKVPFLPGENTEGFAAAIAATKAKIRRDEGRLQEIADKGKAAKQALLKKYGVKTVEELPEDVQPKDNRIGISEADQERERVYRKRMELLKRELNRYQGLAFSVSSGGEKPTQEVAILIGGALESPGESVSPGVLSAVYESNSAKAPSAWNTIPGDDQGRRLALASWMASPNHPLTARVMVNRIWQYHFGKGLVETSNNFGKMGKRPTHPELLDWLAQDFVEHGWSVKAMHRRIMRSAAYQRGSTPTDPAKLKEVDPDNRLLAIYPPRRLTAEELRDAILSVSGELSPTAGGPGVFPELNKDVALQPRQIMGTIAPAYVPSPTREQRHRRTVYTIQMRNLGNPMQEVFNAADMNSSCERREATTVAPQVFALFNGEFAHDMALAMARRLESRAEEPAGQIDQAFRLAFGRKPSDQERAVCLSHRDKMLEHHRQTDPPSEEVPPAQVLRSHIGELSGKRFEFIEEWGQKDIEPNLKPADVSAETRALAEVCLVILNANEFIYLP